MQCTKGRKTPLCQGEPGSRCLRQRGPEQLIAVSGSGQDAGEHLCQACKRKELKGFSYFLAEISVTELGIWLHLSISKYLFLKTKPFFCPSDGLPHLLPHSNDAQFIAFCMLIKATTQHKVTAPKFTSSFKSPCSKADQSSKPLQTHSVWHTA